MVHCGQRFMESRSRERRAPRTDLRPLERPALAIGGVLERRDVADDGKGGVHWAVVLVPNLDGECARDGALGGVTRDERVRIEDQRTDIVEHEATVRSGQYEVVDTRPGHDHFPRVSAARD